MRTWLIERWTDPAKFIGTVRAGLYLLGELFERGVIPTTIDGGGRDVGGLLKIVAVGMAAGDQTPHVVTEAAREITGER